MWQVLLANKWTRLAGIVVVVAGLSFAKGCSVGYGRGEAAVQKEFNQYKEQIAEDLAGAQAAVLKAVQEGMKAQSDLALLQSQRRDVLREEIRDVKQQIAQGFRLKLDDNCKPTDDELQIARSALDKARAGTRKN